MERQAKQRAHELQADISEMIELDKRGLNYTKSLNDGFEVNFLLIFAQWVQDKDEPEQGTKIPLAYFKPNTVKQEGITQEELNKVESILQENTRLKQENADLLQWKQEAMVLNAKWKDVSTVVGLHPCSKIGDSITENAIKLIFTDSKISSIDIKIVMIFLRFRKIPHTPITNSKLDKTR